MGLDEPPDLRGQRQASEGQRRPAVGGEDPRSPGLVVGQAQPLLVRPGGDLELWGRDDGTVLSDHLFFGGCLFGGGGRKGKGWLRDGHTGRSDFLVAGGDTFWGAVARWMAPRRFELAP